MQGMHEKRPEEASMTYKETGQYNYEAVAQGMVDAGYWNIGLVQPWGMLEEKEKRIWRNAAYQVIRKGWAEPAPKPRHRRADKRLADYVQPTRMDRA